MISCELRGLHWTNIKVLSTLYLDTLWTLSDSVWKSGNCSDPVLALTRDLDPVLTFLVYLGSV